MEGSESFDGEAPLQCGSFERLLTAAFATVLTWLLWLCLAGLGRPQRAPSLEPVMDAEPDLPPRPKSADYVYPPPYEDHLRNRAREYDYDDEEEEDGKDFIVMYVHDNSGFDSETPEYVPPQGGGYSALQRYFLETIVEENSDDLRSDESLSDSGRWGWDSASTDGVQSVIHVPIARGGDSEEETPSTEPLNIREDRTKEEELDKWLEESIRELEEEQERLDRLQEESPPQSVQSDAERQEFNLEAAIRQSTGHSCDDSSDNTQAKLVLPFESESNTTGRKAFDLRNDLQDDPTKQPRELRPDLDFANSDLLIVFDNDTDEETLSTVFTPTDAHHTSCSREFASWNDAIDEYLTSLARPNLWERSTDGAISPERRQNETKAEKALSDLVIQNTESNLYINDRFQQLCKENIVDFFTTGCDALESDVIIDKASPVMNDNQQDRYLCANLSEEGSQGESTSGQTISNDARNNPIATTTCASVSQSKDYQASTVDDPISLWSRVAEGTKPNRQLSIPAIDSEPVVGMDGRLRPLEIVREEEGEDEQVIGPNRTDYDKSVAVLDSRENDEKPPEREWSSTDEEEETSSDDECLGGYRGRIGLQACFVCEDLTQIADEKDDDFRSDSDSDKNYECFNGLVNFDLASSLGRSLSLSDLDSLREEQGHSMGSVGLGSTGETDKRDEEYVLPTPPATRPSTENLSEDSGYCDAGHAGSSSMLDRADADSPETPSDPLSEDDLRVRPRRTKAFSCDGITFDPPRKMGIIPEEEQDSTDEKISSNNASKLRLERLLIRDDERRAKKYTDADLTDARDIITPIDEQRKNARNYFDFTFEKHLTPLRIEEEGEEVRKKNVGNTYPPPPPSTTYVYTTYEHDNPEVNFRDRNRKPVDESKMRWALSEVGLEDDGNQGEGVYDSGGPSSWQEQILEKEWERAIKSGRAATDDWLVMKPPADASRPRMTPSRSLDHLSSWLVMTTTTSSPTEEVEPFLSAPPALATVEQEATSCARSYAHCIAIAHVQTVENHGGSQERTIPTLGEQEQGQEVNGTAQTKYEQTDDTRRHHELTLNRGAAELSLPNADTALQTEELLQEAISISCHDAERVTRRIPENVSTPSVRGPELATCQYAAESLTGATRTPEHSAESTSTGSSSATAPTTAYGRLLSRKLARLPITPGEPRHEGLKYSVTEEHEMFTWTSPRHVSRVTIPPSSPERTSPPSPPPPTQQPPQRPQTLIPQPLPSPPVHRVQVTVHPAPHGAPHIAIFPTTSPTPTSPPEAPVRRPPPPKRPTTTPPPRPTSPPDAVQTTHPRPLPSNLRHDAGEKRNSTLPELEPTTLDSAAEALQASEVQLERAIWSLESELHKQGFFLHDKPSSTKQPSKPPIPPPTPPRLPPVAPSRTRIINARKQFFTKDAYPPPTSPPPPPPPIAVSAADTAELSTAFQRFRERAKEGRERVARSVVDLNEVERACRRPEIDLTTAAPTPAPPSALSPQPPERREVLWRARSRSTSAGYLETNLDTLETTDAQPPAPPSPTSPPGKPKASSMLNLRPREDPPPPPDPSDRARSMEFLLDEDNKAAAQPPENLLMMQGNAPADQASATSVATTASDQRALSQHELRIQTSLQRLDVPDWFKSSPYSKGGGGGVILAKGKSVSQELRWPGLSSKSTSATSLGSSSATEGAGGPSSARRTAAATRVHPPYCWRYPRWSRESLPSPCSPSPSPQERGQFQFSRWSSSRLSSGQASTSSATCSTTPSPTGSLNRGGFGVRQPYLGWRSSERLTREVASANSTPTHFYRSAAERLSAGPGYYALRFGYLFGKIQGGSDGNLGNQPTATHTAKPSTPTAETITNHLALASDSPTASAYPTTPFAYDYTHSYPKSYTPEPRENDHQLRPPTPANTSASVSPLSPYTPPAENEIDIDTPRTNGYSPKHEEMPSLVEAGVQSPKSPRRRIWMESSFVGVRSPKGYPPPPGITKMSFPMVQPIEATYELPLLDTHIDSVTPKGSVDEPPRLTKAKRSFGQIQDAEVQPRDPGSSVATLEEVLDSLLAIPTCSRSVSPSGPRTQFYFGDDSDPESRLPPPPAPIVDEPFAPPPEQGEEAEPPINGEESGSRSSSFSTGRRVSPTSLLHRQAPPQPSSPTHHEHRELASLQHKPPAPLVAPAPAAAALHGQDLSDDEEEELVRFSRRGSQRERRLSGSQRPPTPPPRPLHATAISASPHVTWGGTVRSDDDEQPTGRIDTAATEPSAPPPPPEAEDGEAKDVDGGSARKRGGSEQLRHLLPDDLLVRCSYPRCARTVELAEARRSFKTCHNCYTYYCSRDCRRLHWDKHRRTCMYSRIRSLCKHILVRGRDDPMVLAHLSKLARTGALTQGRGFIKLIFRNPELGERFVQQGWSALEDNPMYVAWRDLLPQELGPDIYHDVTELCKQYNPESKFIFLAAIYVTREIPAQPVPRWEREVIAKFTKLPLRRPGGSTGDQYGDPALEPDTLILTAVPQPMEAVLPQRARELCFTNIQKHLRTRGVSLRHQFPDVYQKLTAYVENSELFPPITIYPKDGRTGKTFMCLIMPNTEPEIAAMVKDFSRK